MSKEVTARTSLTTGASVQALIPTDIEQAFRFATAIAQSGMAPKSYGAGENLPQAVFTAMQLGAEVGLPPMSAVQNIAVINGKPGLYGDAQLALVRSSGLLVHFKEEYVGEPYESDFRARCSVQREGQDVPDIHEFSVADAQTAGLWNKQGPWRQYPKRMLRFRARAFALRDNFGDVLLGLGSTIEELKDHTGPENARDITPPRPERSAFADAEEVSFEFVDQYGEARGFADLNLYAAAFLTELKKTVTPEAAQGVWESNQGYIDDLPSNLLDEISQALSEATAAHDATDEDWKSALKLDLSNAKSLEDAESVWKAQLDNTKALHKQDQNAFNELSQHFNKVKETFQLAAQ